jgi:hypothetical protein
MTGHLPAVALSFPSITVLRFWQLGVVKQGMGCGAVDLATGPHSASCGFLAPALAKSGD